MSEYIATARVQVLPDLDNFTTDLTRDLNNKIKAFNATSAKKLKPIQIPVQAGAIASKGLTQSVSQTTSALNKQVKSTSVLGGSMGRLDRKIGDTRAKMLGLGSATARVDAALLGLRTAVGSTAVIGLGAGALAAIALGNALRRTIGITVEFERELNTFQAVTGASANEMERVAAAAKQLGADVTLPAVSAADAAVAMAELAKAGLSVQDAIDGARGVLQLATAANIGFADAVEIAASAINAFGLSGKDAVKVADTLANAANAAQGSITDIGIAFQQANAVGALAGLTFQDTTVFLTQLAQAGLKSSDAGTSLRTALIRLINPSKKAAEIIKELGIEIRDEAGNIRPDIFLQFASAMQGMSKETRDAKLAVIGGQDALRAFAILGRASVKDFLALRRELREEGTAAEVAAARTKGLGGSFQALQSTLETLGITLGQKVSPGLTDFVNGVTSSISALSQSQGVAAAFQAGLTGVATALNAVGAAASIVGPILLGTVNLLSKVTLGFGSSLVTGLLAAIAGLKLYSAVAKSAIVSNTLLRASMLHLTFVQAAAGATQAAGAIGGLTRTIVGLRAAIALALTSVNFWAIGITAVAAGLIYLATRESGVEKATRGLKEATEGLVSAQGAAKTAAEGLAGALRADKTSELAIAQAQLAKATAAAALASSSAAAGSRERRGLEINLAIATQDVTFAMQDATTAAENLATAQLENEAATLAANAAIDKQVEALQKLALEAALGDRPSPGDTGGAIPGGDLFFKLTDKLGITDATTELEVFNKKIRESAEDLLTSGDAALVFRGKALLAVASLQEALGRGLTPIQWRRLLAEKDLPGIIDRISRILKASGVEVGEVFLFPILEQAGLIPEKAGKEIVKNARALEKAALIVGNRVGKVLGETTTAAFFSALSLSDITNIFEATGVPVSEQLRKLRVRAAKQQAEVDRLNAIPKGQRTKEQQDKLVQQSAALNATNAEIRRIQSDIRSAQEERVRLAEQAQDDQDKAGQALFDVLTSTGKGIRALNTKLEDAGVTPTLTDDIKFTKILLAVYRRIQKNLRKRLQALGVSNDEIKKLMRAINDLVNETRRDLEKLQQDQAERIQDALTTRLDLRIRLAEVRGNVAAEIKARRAKLKAIQDEIKKLENQKKKNTNAWLELKIAEAEEQKAIKELEGQTKEKNKAQASLMFAFLQAQQGFAANLLGNLIPGGATSGLVGNAPPSGSTTAGGTPSFGFGIDPKTGRPLGESGRSPRGDLVAQAQVSAGVKLGPSRGQATSQTEILRQILATLKDIKRGQGFPAAKNQGANSKTSLDMGHGGGGGGGMAATA